jgi:Zn-finger nucleic acid-binding protein
VVEAIEASAYCPRCRSPLTARAVGAVGLDECHACGGVFLDAADLSALVFDRPSAQALAADLRARPAIPTTRPLRGSCPVCAHALLVRVVPRLGARALACRSHGVWLERDQLVRAAGLLGDGSIDARSCTDILAFLLS